MKGSPSDSPSFLSILLIIRLKGSIYLDSCFSLSRYCCSSVCVRPAGLGTEPGFPVTPKEVTQLKMHVLCKPLEEAASKHSNIFAVEECFWCTLNIQVDSESFTIVHSPLRASVLVWESNLVQWVVQCWYLSQLPPVIYRISDLNSAPV